MKFSGTGYSFTNKGYAQNETKVGEDLYSALIQFFTLFPDLQKNDFFVSGESYGGKYVPAIAHTIHQKNPSAKLKINLQGTFIFYLYLIINNVCQIALSNDLSHADSICQIM